MSIDGKNKRTFLWLTGEEAADTIQKESALTQVKTLAKNGQQAVVFISGERDLFSQTKGLLKHNAGTME